MASVGGVETWAASPAKGQPVRLAGRNFGALFRTDRDARRIEFTVTLEGKERECWVEVLPLDKDQLNALQRLSDGRIGRDSASDVLDFVVGHTVVDFLLWERPVGARGERGSARQVRPADGTGRGAGIPEQIRTSFRALPEFWEALVEECLDENGWSAEAQGN